MPQGKPWRVVQAGAQPHFGQTEGSQLGLTPAGHAAHRLSAAQEKRSPAAGHLRAERARSGATARGRTGHSKLLLLPLAALSTILLPEAAPHPGCTGTQTCQPAPPFSVPSLSFPTPKRAAVTPAKLPGCERPRAAEKRPPSPLHEAVRVHGLPDIAHQQPSLIATHCLMTVIRKSKAA